MVIDKIIQELENMLGEITPSMSPAQVMYQAGISKAINVIEKYRKEPVEFKPKLINIADKVIKEDF